MLCKLGWFALFKCLSKQWNLTVTQLSCWVCESGKVGLGVEWKPWLPPSSSAKEPPMCWKCGRASRFEIQTWLHWHVPGWFMLQMRFVCLHCSSHLNCFPWVTSCRQIIRPLWWRHCCLMLLMRKLRFEDFSQLERPSELGCWHSAPDHILGK